MDYSSFKTWFETLGRAWENRDPHAAAELFTENASYHENPFDEPLFFATGPKRRNSRNKFRSIQKF